MEITNPHYLSTLVEPEFTPREPDDLDELMFECLGIEPDLRPLSVICNEIQALYSTLNIGDCSDEALDALWNEVKQINVTQTP